MQALGRMAESSLPFSLEQGFSVAHISLLWESNPRSEWKLCLKGAHPPQQAAFSKRILEERTSWLSRPWLGPVVSNNVLVSFPDVVIKYPGKNSSREKAVYWGLLGATHSVTKEAEATLHPQKETGSGQGYNTQEPPSVTHFLQRGSTS